MLLIILYVQIAICIVSITSASYVMLSIRTVVHGRPYIFDSRIFYFEYYYKGGSGYRYGTVYTVYIYTIILIG